jgi:hypothetical protein
LIKLQVRGSSSRLGRFTPTPIVEAEYMAATGFLTQILRQVLAPRLGPYMAERSEFELPVPVSKLSYDSIMLGLGEQLGMVDKEKALDDRRFPRPLSLVGVFCQRQYGATGLR